MIKKQHYRAVFKSDHLSSYDLEDFTEQGRPLEFTIKHVTQELKTKVAGRKIDANVAYFIEPIKPLVLNATNSKIISKFANTPFVNDWKNIPIELYIQKGITFGKETVQGIRIKETPPKAITEHEVKLIKDKVSLIVDLKALNVFYAGLTPKEKTHKEIIEILKEKQIDLKQQ
tara:strand:+ start:820 stop:1338 length:519 start_codon:yes stop_codon:yes gene_type:complete